MKIAEVIPLTRTTPGREQFTYSVPESLVLEIGSVVEVEFGKRAVAAVVMKVSQIEALPYPVKPIDKLLWPQPIFTLEQMKICKFISEEYAAPFGLCMKLAFARFAPRATYKFPNTQNNRARIDISRFTEDQKKALETITSCFGKYCEILLHGVTGSGKTEVYLETAKRIVDNGKQVLLLVPEIALTPQTLERVSTYFPADSIGLVHSRLSYGQKSSIWKGVFENRIKVLIGPRSALFAPFVGLGLIIMDEEHDSSFKQFDTTPRYEGRRVVAELSRIWNVPLVYSDATPSVDTYYASQEKKIEYLSLPVRPNQPMPSVELIDMTEELKTGNFSVFSSVLIKAIKSQLEQKQQTILFVNRRGTSTSVQCKDCGQFLLCERCEVPLVYHASKNLLICHHCLREYPIPATCPNCESVRLKFLGSGTEKIEAEISRLFLGARVSRLDSDAVSGKGDLEKFYDDFTNGRIDIVVGTQLVAKGWDLSKVGLIGVINADTGLAFPDFRSNERTFQLITQVSGRAGRGDFPGKVIVQTFTPQNFAIQAAAKHDYQQFYAREITDRKEFEYPPFSRLIKITVNHSKQEKAENLAQKVFDEIQALKLPIELIGPSAAFIPRVRGRYLFYVIIKLKINGSVRSLPLELRNVLRKLPTYWKVDVDPESLL